MPAKIEVPNFDDLLCRYLAGESENKLAREANINRQTFRRLLLESDIQPRGRSAAEKVKWSQMSPAQRAAQVAAAHAAAKGRTITWDEMCRQALGKERAGTGIVPVETELATQLRQAGYSITQQKAVGIYNVDVAINEPPIAVEIFGGNWHCSGRHRARFHKRVKYLLDAGWAVVIVWIDARRYPLGAGCTENIIALAEELRSNPAARREYRVILGNGQPAPVRQNYFNTPADIERLSGG